MELEAVKSPHVYFPISGVPLNTLFAYIPLFLQTHIGVETTNIIPVKEPKQFLMIIAQKQSIRELDRQRENIPELRCYH